MVEALAQQGRPHPGGSPQQQGLQQPLPTLGATGLPPTTAGAITFQGAVFWAISSWNCSRAFR
jgi:hypothetical protein